MNIINFIITQVKVTGFDKVSEISPLHGLLVAIILILGGVIIYLYKKNNDDIKDHANTISQLNSTYNDKIGELNSKHSDQLLEIRKEMIKLEDERNTKIRESEKEILGILNGVNNVLELSEKNKDYDTKMILNELNEIKKSIEKLHDIYKNR